MRTELGPLEPEKVPDTWQELMEIFSYLPVYCKEAEMRQYGKIVHGVFMGVPQALPTIDPRYYQR